MKKIPYFNDADHIVFMGGVMVPPGETRLVDEALIVADPAVADDGGNAAVVDSPDSFNIEKLEELLKNKQDDVLKAIPGLSLASVEALGELEQAGQARKGILGAVAERLLESAAGSEQQ